MTTLAKLESEMKAVEKKRDVLLKQCKRLAEKVWALNVRILHLDIRKTRLLQGKVKA
jgi:hypothetical protein